MREKRNTIKRVFFSNHIFGSHLFSALHVFRMSDYLPFFCEHKHPAETLAHDHCSGFWRFILFLNNIYLFTFFFSTSINRTKFFNDVPRWHTCMIEGRKTLSWYNFRHFISILLVDFTCVAYRSHLFFKTGKWNDLKKGQNEMEIEGSQGESQDFVFFVEKDWPQIYCMKI